MRFIRNKFILSLNMRGLAILILSMFNIFIAGINAYMGEWICLLNLAVAFLMWVLLYDKRNFKNE
jgi:hypothetical protein